MAESRICLTYDFDAVAAWTSSEMLDFQSWGIYGADVATPRLLDLHDRHDVPATWFIPGHTIESFPSISGEIWDRGYDVQHHGWSHESPSSFETRDAELADFERGIEAIRDLTGRKPAGYRAPGHFSEHTVELLEKFGFEWDSSNAAHDFRPYRLHKNWSAPIRDPYDRGVKSDLAEVPYIWHRDDWMQLFPVVSGTEWVAYSTEDQIFTRWREELRWMHENIENGVFVLLFHPQCAGRAPFFKQLESFIEEITKTDSMKFTEIGEIANEVD